MTDELAARLDLPVSGLHNAELTSRTSDLVDRLLEADDDDTLWDYFPGLAKASIGLVAREPYRRYQRGDIDFARFRWLLLKTTGLKAAKLALLTTALMIPGLIIATRAVLVASMISGSPTCFDAAHREHGPIGQRDQDDAREGRRHTFKIVDSGLLLALKRRKNGAPPHCRTLRDHALSTCCRKRSERC